MRRSLYPFSSVVAVIMVCFSYGAYAQEKCGTVALEEKYRPLIGESLPAFESWVQAKKTARILRLSTERTAEAVYTIPVVVHVLHQGEDYGVDSNIPDEQIFSQIELLNRDFRRLNTDTTETRAMFKSVAADSFIEFVLAKRDPEGLPSTGIVRAKADNGSYSIGQEDLLHKISYWPPEEYLNIWVTNLTSGLLGFAQFPVSSLVGLNDNIANKFLADGVTVDYQYFGQGFNAQDFSTGRTATHEIGHFLGLRHTWGDGGCGVDDYCDDTPLQQRASSSATCELSKMTCESTDMIENFMDYSPDRCMNIFTLDQKERMRTILDYSPRRKSLWTSKALLPPVQVALDLGIKEIVLPGDGICSANFMPEVEVRNYGSSVITQFEVRAFINGLEWDSRTISTTLPAGAIYTVNFDEVFLEEAGLYSSSFEIIQVNGAKDGNSDNDMKTVEAAYQRAISLPLLETFEDSKLHLLQKSDYQDASFAAVNNAASLSATNKAMKFAYYSADSSHFGSWDLLLSPTIDVTKYSSLTIDFDYAYGHDGLHNADGLLVAVSSDCGSTFDFDNIVFQRFGQSLSTAIIAPGTEFTPTNPAEWKTALINLNNFAGAKEIQLAFIGQNGLGNNLYLDDIRISSNDLADYDIGISEVSDLSFISCISSPVPSVEVKNFGKQPLSSFTVSYSAAGIDHQIFVDNILLQTGEITEVPLPLEPLEDGTYTLELAVNLPNGNADQRISDNDYSELFHIKTAREVLPFRESFASSRGLEETMLYRLDNEQGMSWQIENDENLSTGNKVALMPSFDLSVLGEEYWLATKVLDLDAATEASMSFMLSYAKRDSRSERLRVLVSVDCGINFRDVVYDKRGSDLAVKASEEAWTPATADDWRRETIDLSAYAGNPNVVVALVGTNGHGNNLYLDDIEFYLSSEPTPVFPAAALIRLFPNPARELIHVAFNLPERQTVLLRMQDVRGRVYFEKEYPNTLNQVYELATLGQANGLYLIQVITKEKSTAQRVIVWH